MKMSSTPLADGYRAALATAGEPKDSDHADLSGDLAGDLSGDLAVHLSDAARDALERELAAICERAEQTWPGVALTRVEFVGYLAECGVPLQSQVQSDAGAESGAGTITDVYLAHACGRGDPAALAHLERHYLARVPGAVAHMKLPAATVDEVTQQVRDKLLVAGPGAQPKIAGYAGRGKLRGLIQLVAVRTAISLLRKHKREVYAEPDDFTALPAPLDDPELGYLKARYRREFRSAFADSVADLTARERNLLRLHLLRGVTLAALAEMYSVHKATVTRWLAKARATLFAGTRRRMRAQLSCDADEFESVMRLIQSRLDVSVQRLFATRDTDEPTG